jgi:hypothetical protein
MGICYRSITVKCLSTLLLQAKGWNKIMNKRMKVLTSANEIYEAIEELQEQISNNGIANQYNIVFLNDGEIYTYGKTEKYSALSLLKYMYEMDIVSMRIFEYDNGIINIDIVTVED